MRSPSPSSAFNEPFALVTSGDLPFIMQALFRSPSLRMGQDVFRRILKKARISSTTVPSRADAESEPLSPGARLPAELLMPIFDQVKETWKPFWDGLGQHERLGWIVLTHVCRRWRLTILDMPWLWTDVSVQAGGWPQEFMRRSRNQRLQHVAFTTSSGIRKPYHQLRDVDQLIANLHRLESFTHKGYHVYWFLQHAFAPAPYLRNLSLSVQEPGKKYRKYQRHFIIPSDVFAGVVPALRELTLWDIPVDFSSPLLSANLTHLALGRGPPRGREPCAEYFSLLDFLGVLRRMPNLRLLKAHDILTGPENTHSLLVTLDQSSHVVLPHLESLEIYSPRLLNYCALIVMLECNWTLLKLDMTTILSMPEGHRIIQLLPAQVTGSSIPGVVPPLASLRIFSGDARMFSVEGWRTLDVETDDGRWNKESSSFSATIMLAGAKASDGVLSLCAQFQLNTIEKLCLSWYTSPLHHWSGENNPGDWVPLLQQMDAVQCIHIPIVDSFPEIAAALLGTLDGSGNYFLPCPRLRELHFGRIPYKASMTGDFFDLLAHVLGIRQRHGLALRKLVVDNISLPCTGPNDFLALREVRIGK